MTPIEQLKQLSLSLGAKVLENEPMSRHTSFKIGGPADIFITAYDEYSILKIHNFCIENSIPLFIIGNGSNLLVSDKGIRGAVLKYGGDKIVCDGKIIICHSGASLHALCETARSYALTGLEFAHGIPGTVGGAVVMNAGAYGGEMKDVVKKVYHVSNGNLCAYEREHLEFAYRKSVYTEKNYAITKVEFELEPGDKQEISARMNELMEKRRTKQPLNFPSAGSVFKRPAGHFAGALIEACGLKGCRIGGAKVSEKHAGFIVNTGGATCDDVLKLIEKIKETVLSQTGVVLECEIKTVGEW